MAYYAQMLEKKSFSGTFIASKGCLAACFKSMMGHHLELRSPRAGKNFVMKGFFESLHRSIEEQSRFKFEQLTAKAQMSQLGNRHSESIVHLSDQDNGIVPAFTAIPVLGGQK